MASRPAIKELIGMWREPKGRGYFSHMVTQYAHISWLLLNYACIYIRTPSIYEVMIY